MSNILNKSNRIDTWKKIEFTGEQMKELQFAFNLFDEHGTGYIPTSDILVVFSALGYDLSLEELKSLYAELNLVMNDSIDLTMFTNLLIYKINEGTSKDDLVRYFNIYDKDGKGYITFNDLKQIAKYIGYDNLTNEQLLEMLSFSHSISNSTKSNAFLNDPLDYNITINKEEFIKLMTIKYEL